MRASHVAHQTSAGGFSLVELLVVIAIMGVLASIGLPLAELAQKRTQEQELRRSLREIRSALDEYKRLVDQGFIQRAADASGYPSDLDALVTGVADAKSPAGRKLFLMRRLPRDPFAPGEGSAAETWALRSYSSSPDDPQPGKDIFDVHSKSAGVGLNGIAYREW